MKYITGKQTQKIIIIFFAFCCMAMKCVKDCANFDSIPSKADSIQARVINKQQTNTAPTELKINEFMISVNTSISPIDSIQTFYTFCGVLELTDTLVDVKIFTEYELNANYPANADITALFRVVQFDYAIEKPYYLTIPQWVKTNKMGQNGFLLAESIKLALPIIFQARVEYNFRNKNLTSVTPSITLH
jgi:hypothetical protein